ncbi:MAG: hypothetical protein RIS84_804, partial [Pseudomonadota bacterium]
MKKPSKTTVLPAAAKSTYAPLFERLEERVLFSANPLVAALDTPPVDTTHDSTLNDLHTTFAPTLAATDVALPADKTAKTIADAPTNVLNTPTTLTSTAEPKRIEIVFVDAGIRNYQNLVDAYQNQNPEGIDLKVVVIGHTDNAVQEISDTLAAYEKATHKVDAVHILSHATDGSLQLGTNTFDLKALEGNTQVAQTVSAWKLGLSQGADILLYGCNVAATDVGVEFTQELSALTGAQVAASTDNTGSKALGGNWQLEQETGAINTQTLSTPVEVLLAPTATATLNVPATNMLNENFDFKVIFDNSSSVDTEVGYGPFFDLRIPAGVKVGTPSYFDTNLDASLWKVVGTWDGTRWVDSAGAAVAKHPYGAPFTMPGDAVSNTPAIGDKWYLVQLPFGSFVPNQPNAEIVFKGNVLEETSGVNASNPHTGFPTVVPQTTLQP